jgi:hypothetical protein
MRALAVLLCSAVLLGCGPGTGPEPENLSGTYSLWTVQDSAVPMTWWSGLGGWSQILQGEIALRGDASFRHLVTHKHHLRGPPALEFSRTDTLSGSYLRKESTIVLTVTDASVDTLRHEGIDLTRMAPLYPGAAPVPWVYRRSAP